MPDMKEYLVILRRSDKAFIVSAKNAKDALNQVWENHIELYNEYLRSNGSLYYIYEKSDLSARSLGSLHNEQGKIICL